MDVPTVARQPEFGKRAYDLYGNRKFYWEEKDEYGVYRDDREFARDLDGHTIPVHTKDIRRLLERASRDEPAYISLPEHASSFTQTKLVPEIYPKDEINEMFYGVCGEHEKNKEAFQMKLDGVYYPLNDSISWLTTCMEEMKQDIARIQNATDVARPPSIDRRQPQSIDSRQSPSIDRHHHASIDNRLAASIDTNPPRPHTMKSQPDFHTREEVDQLVEGIYRALETTEERLDGRYDDIYFPMDLTIKKDEYGVYRDDREFARDLDGHTIPVHTKDIRRLLERTSRDEPAYICLPEHASSFTQTKLVPEIYTKDEINEMFYGVCGEHEKNKEAFQMKLDGVYYPLNDSISWLTTCMEEMKRCCSTSIDRQKTTPIDRQQTIIIDRQTPSRIDRQPLGRINRHQSATPTQDEVSTRFPHQRRETRIIGQELEKDRYAATKRVLRSVARLRLSSSQSSVAT
ncbi:hypothetical protein F2Q68_00038961 [Brassica cretica]|uniref:Uncharacterized protein n=1 Tax=Brassica cretica TaxID=69181 RepID=A0A8S9MDU6_BRACR|nr:hypothetical protein F2Q68_00038961 [Brassica cretica]